MNLATLSKKLGEVIHHALTGADNQTYALGRLVSVPFLGATLALPFTMLFTRHEFTLADAGIYVGAAAGGFMALVRGTSDTEPK